MLTLYDWSFRERSQGGVYAWGLVTGHPKLPNGLLIHTSLVLKLRVEEDRLLARTASDHLYTLRPEEIDGTRWEETGSRLASFGVGADLVERWARARQEADRWRLEELGRELAPGELLLEVVGNTTARAFFRTAQGELKRIEPELHVGMFQDSVLLTDWADRTVDFRYFPKEDRLEPYHISDGLAAIRLNNLGTTDVYFGAEGRVARCPAGELTVLPAAEFDREGLISPDAVNGKSLLRTKPDAPEGL